MEFKDRYALLAKAFLNTNDLTKEEFIARAFDTVFDLIPEAEKGSYYELTDDKFKPIYSNGYDMKYLSKLNFNKDDVFIDFASIESQEIDSYEVEIKSRDDNKFDKETLEIIKKLGTYSNFISLYAPIKVNNKIGLMCLENFTNKFYSKESKTLLALYAQLISNFYSMKISQEKLENKYQDVISALVSAIEVNDVYTNGHSKRVRDMSEKVAIKLKFSEQRLDILRSAAILHDIGKIGIPTEILNKPGKLTEEEYSIVKGHPFHAKKILEKIEGFEEISELAYCHHEHYNGSGYPRGLSKDKIPLEAQIIQVVDAFDAMTSERPYRKALSNEKAFSILKEERGEQFHPQLVDIMLEICK